MYNIQFARKMVRKFRNAILDYGVRPVFGKKNYGIEKTLIQNLQSMNKTSVTKSVTNLEISKSLKILRITFDKNKKKIIAILQKLPE